MIASTSEDNNPCLSCNHNWTLAKTFEELLFCLKCVRGKDCIGCYYEQASHWIVKPSPFVIHLCDIDPHVRWHLDQLDENDAIKVGDDVTHEFFKIAHSPEYLGLKERIEWRFEQ